MPRQARLDAPGALHPVMIRGIEGAAIFRNGEEREAFLARVERIVEVGASSVYRIFGTSFLNGFSSASAFQQILGMGGTNPGESRETSANGGYGSGLSKAMLTISK